MIKTYVYHGNNNNVAGAGALGISGWMKINSPQRIIRLLSLDFMFNSYANVSGLQDNPYISQTNYFNCEVDQSGLTFPLYDAFNTMAPGNRILTPTLFFNRPGRFECDLEFENEFWMAVFTYNYDALATIHTHTLQILAQVEELPL